jgi:hypothetical protein
MENIKGQIKKQCGKEPEPEIEAEGRRNTRNRELMKYYAHKEAAVSLEDLKLYERLFNFEKTPESGGGEQKQEKEIGKRCRKEDIFTTGGLEGFFNPESQIPPAKPGACFVNRSKRFVYGPPKCGYLC